MPTSLHHLLPLFLIAIGGSPHSDAIEPKAAGAGASRDFAAWVDSLARAKQEEYALPGLAIGIVRDGAVVYTAGYGVKSLETGQPVTDRSVFHTASVSKLFTAQAVIELVEEGRLRLEDQLRDLAPELRLADPAAGDITVRQLLNHTSGLPDIGNYRWKRQHRKEASLRRYVRRTKWRPRTTPGSTYRYSNLGYDLLGYLIEKASGQSFEDYLEQQILAPSGMRDSDFRYFNIPPGLRTAPHTRRGAGGKVRVRPVYPYTREHAPSSTLNASVNELSQWMIWTLDRLTTDEDYRVLTTPATPVYEGIGLGFQLSSLYGQRTAGHYGGDQGFRSYLLLIPDQRIGLVVLANSDRGEDFRQEILHTVARQMLNLGGGP